MDMQLGFGFAGEPVTSAPTRAPTRAPRAKAGDAPRRMDHTGRPLDRQPINPGDVFATSSGSRTTPFPKQKSRRFLSQWVIDNAVAEAERRGDDFNATGFRAEKPLRDGTLPMASSDAMNEYLFGIQPAVPPRFLKRM